MPSLIGVDVGGTQIRAALFNADLVLLERANQLSHAEEGADAVMDRIIETINQVFPEDPDDLVGVGLAMPGPVDGASNMLLETPNLPFKNSPIGDIVKKSIGKPVYLGNDADLAGLAEYELGAGRESNNMIYMTISTGIGGGIIVNGKPYIGSGIAGELGHMVVLPDGPLCGCGHRGHIEAISSGTAIARTARERLEQGAASVLSEMCHNDLGSITSKMVGEAALDGDELAVEIITRAGHYLGIHVTSLMVSFNPDMFVFGGGVSHLGALLFDPMQDAIHEYCINERYWKGVPLRIAELGEDVGLYGAGAFVRAMSKN